MSVPYIGAKISLVSRSEIRYEGILAEVDPVESTIGLEHGTFMMSNLSSLISIVMMMGTEGRKGPGENIPASQQVYDFILFRSSDIKDLQVCEAAPAAPVSPPMGFVDPAIVHHQFQAQQPQQQGYSQYQQPQQQQHGAWHGQPKLQFGSSNYVAPSYSAAPGYGSSSLQFGSAQQSFYQQHQAQQQQARQQPAQAPQMYQDFAQPAAPQQQPVAPKQQQQQRMPQPQSKVHPEAASNVVSLTPKSDQKAAAAEDSKVLSYSTGTKKSQLVNPPPQPPTGKLSYASMVAGGRTEPPKKAPAAAPAAALAAPSRPGSFRPPAEHSKAAAAPDFSFEASQAGLQNLTTAQAEVFKAIQDKSFYSKSSSFFDDISCDAKDGKADDSRLRNERSWNVETFGVPAPPSTYNSGYSSRGGSSSSRGGPSRGGRGGGRGGYRGGRGGSTSAKA